MTKIAQLAPKDDMSRRKSFFETMNVQILPKFVSSIATKRLIIISEIMKTLFSKIITPTYTSNWYSDLMLALPRIIGCYFLAVNFGGSKFPCPDWFIHDMVKFGGIFAMFPAFFAWAAVLAETFGGALLVLGLFTRFAGSMVMITMLVAIFFQKWGGEVWEMLPAMGFLWISIYAVVMGSGRFGIDHFIAQKLFKKDLSHQGTEAPSILSLH